MLWGKTARSRAMPQKRQTIGHLARDRLHEAMAGLLARGSTTDADLPGCPVIISGVVLPLTVAGAATASAFRPAPCSLLIPEGNHQELRIALPGRRQPHRRTGAATTPMSPPRSAMTVNVDSRRRLEPLKRRKQRSFPGRRGGSNTPVRSAFRLWPGRGGERRLRFRRRRGHRRDRPRSRSTRRD